MHCDVTRRRFTPRRRLRKIDQPGAAARGVSTSNGTSPRSEIRADVAYPYANVVYASGSADYTGNLLGFASGLATSHFELTFDVGQPLEFTLYGGVNVYSPDIPLYGLSEVTLSGGPGNQTIAHYFSYDGLYDFYQEGALLPGRYTLIAGSRHNQDGGSAAISASYGLGLDVVLVPEPSTALLLAGGLLALAARRRSRLRPAESSQDSHGAANA